MEEKLSFLDKIGVSRLWQHVLAKIGVKADKAELKELEETLTQQIENIDLSGYETTSDAVAKLTEAKGYADGIKNDLLNGAGGAYDTLKELGDLIDDNTDAIDALEILASKQSDWNQNDETAIDYVKNRTHWVEAGTKVIVPQTNQNSFEQNFSSLVYDAIEADLEYIVIVDGVSYKCTAWHNTVAETCLGDSRLSHIIAEGGEEIADTTHPEDVPFLVNIYEEPGLFGEEGIAFFTIYYPDDNIHTIEILVNDDSTLIYHQLDENYIPDTIARKSDISNIDLSNYYTKSEIDSLELITVADIDTICNASIESANGVTL